MKNKAIAVLKIILLTLLITIVVDRVVYALLNNISDQVYSGQAVGKLNYFTDVKRNVDVLFMGSSRTSRHFDSNLISDNSFNIGMDGKKIAYSATLLQTLPKDRSQVIIFQIDPIYAVDSEYDGRDIEALSVKFHRNKIFKENIKKMKKVNQFQHLYKSIGYNGKVIGVLFNYLEGMPNTNRKMDINP